MIERLKLSRNGWFSSKLSTKESIWGSANDGQVMEYLRKNLLIVKVLEIGMVILKKQPHLLSSPGKAGFLKASSGCNELLKEEEDLQTGDVKGWMESVNIKRKVATRTMGYNLSLASIPTNVCCTDENSCLCYVFSVYKTQVVLQCTVLGSSLAIYVVVLETSVLYTMVLSLSLWIKSQCLTPSRVLGDRSVYEHKWKLTQLRYLYNMKTRL